MPCILAGCVMVSTFIGWRGDNGSIGWFILLAVPYGIVLSLVTGIIGIVMRYILKGVQWFFRGRRWARLVAPDEVDAAVCGKEYYEVYK